MAKVMKLKDRFQKEIAPQLMKELGIKNINALPKLQKVVVNAGLGSMYTSGVKDFSEFVENFKSISGQKPVVINTKKAISNFKLREGMPNGVRVTLRGERMYDFIEKLVNIVFPRVRDFRGISAKSFDGNGNYSIGLKEHIVFPEINPDDIAKIHGLQVCINTSATDDDQGRALLTALGFPFKKAKEIEEVKEEKPVIEAKEEVAKEEAPVAEEVVEEAPAVEEEVPAEKEFDVTKEVTDDNLPGESLPETIEEVEEPENEEPPTDDEEKKD